MFRANNAAAAGRCLARADDLLDGNVIDGPKANWKMPKLWEVLLLSEFTLPTRDGVFELLIIADRLASGWHVSGPLLRNGEVTVVDGVFNPGPGHPHIAGLEWASFNVGEFPTGERS